MPVVVGVCLQKTLGRSGASLSCAERNKSLLWLKLLQKVNRFWSKVCQSPELNPASRWAASAGSKMKKNIFNAKKDSWCLFVQSWTIWLSWMELIKWFWIIGRFWAQISSSPLLPLGGAKVILEKIKNKNTSKLSWNCISGYFYDGIIFHPFIVS